MRLFKRFGNAKVKTLGDADNIRFGQKHKDGQSPATTHEAVVFYTNDSDDTAVDPIEPNEDIEGIICGTSENGDAIGYHDAHSDSYGSGNVTLGGLKVVQLRALGNSLRLRFDNDKAPLETVYAKLRDITVIFVREEGQKRYNAVDSAALSLFVDGEGFKVVDGIKPEGDAPGTDVDTLTPGLDNAEDDGDTIEPPEDGGGTIEPPKETKPAKKNARRKKSTK